jgi:hypothetical protein
VAFGVGFPDGTGVEIADGDGVGATGVTTVDGTGTTAAETSSSARATWAGHLRPSAALRAAGRGRSMSLAPQPP